MGNGDHKVEGPHVEKTQEGSYYEAFLSVDGAKFPIAVMKSGELEARIQEAADAAADEKPSRSSK